MPRETIWDWQVERVAATLILPANGEEIGYPLVSNSEGHHRSLAADDSNPGSSEDFIAVIQTADGQSWLPLADFADSYNWANNPAQVPTFAP